MAEGGGGSLEEASGLWLEHPNFEDDCPDLELLLASGARAAAARRGSSNISWRLVQDLSGRQLLLPDADCPLLEAAAGHPGEAASDDGAVKCDGHESDGHESDGHESDGHESDGHESDGHESDAEGCVVDSILGELVDDAVAAYKRSHAMAVVRSLVGDIVEAAVDTAEAAAAAGGGGGDRQVALQEMPPQIAFLANHPDVVEMRNKMAQSRQIVASSAIRLQAAMKIILYESGRQLRVSYARILVRHAARISEEGASREAVESTIEELREVSDRIVELTVEYLKAAARDVVDVASAGVKEALEYPVSPDNQLT